VVPAAVHDSIVQSLRSTKAMKFINSPRRTG